MDHKASVVNFILTLWRESEGGEGDDGWRGTVRPISPLLEDSPPKAEPVIGLSSLGSAVRAGLERMLGKGNAP